MHLGRRALDGERGVRLQGRAACPDQAEKHSDGLVVGEHERRHPVARREPVTAVPPADGLHRHVEVEQVADVAPDRPLVDAQPVRELVQGAGAAGLKDVEQRQNAGQGFGHASKLSREIVDGYCPVFHLASRHDHDTAAPSHAPDSTALVTGATSGIARTTAACLAARGHAVVVADRSSDRVTGIVEATAQFGDFIPTPPARPQPGRATAPEQIAAARPSA